MKTDNELTFFSKITPMEYIEQLWKEHNIQVHAYTFVSGTPTFTYATEEDELMHRLIDDGFFRYASAYTHYRYYGNDEGSL